jgi:hypothetical protein
VNREGRTREQGGTRKGGERLQGTMQREQRHKETVGDAVEGAGDKGGKVSVFECPAILGSTFLIVQLRRQQTAY